MLAAEATAVRRSSCYSVAAWQVCEQGRPLKRSFSQVAPLLPEQTSGHAALSSHGKQAPPATSLRDLSPLADPARETSALLPCHGGQDLQHVLPPTPECFYSEAKQASKTRLLNLGVSGPVGAVGICHDGPISHGGPTGQGQSPSKASRKSHRKREEVLVRQQVQELRDPISDYLPAELAHVYAGACVRHSAEAHDRRLRERLGARRR